MTDIEALDAAIRCVEAEEERYRRMGYRRCAPEYIGEGPMDAVVESEHLYDALARLRELRAGAVAAARHAEEVMAP